MQVWRWRREWWWRVWRSEAAAADALVSKRQREMRCVYCCRGAAPLHLQHEVLVCHAACNAASARSQPVDPVIAKVSRHERGAE